MMSKIRITSINLRRSRTAATELANLSDSDIYLIQESPFCDIGVSKPGFTYIDNGKTGILIRDNLKRRTAIISKTSMVTLITVGSSTRNSVICGSIYIPPACRTRPWYMMDEVEAVLENYADSKLILGGDFNAFHCSWQSHTEHKNHRAAYRRGIKIAEIASTRDIQLIAPKEATHEKGNIIDFFMVCKLPECKIEESQQVVGTDHKAVTMSVKTDDFKEVRMKMKIGYEAKVNEELSCLDDVKDEQLAEVLEDIYTSKLVPKVPRSRTTHPWYTQSLARLRKMIHKLRATIPNSKVVKTATKLYKAEIQQAKEAYWHERAKAIEKDQNIAFRALKAARANTTLNSKFNEHETVQESAEAAANAYFRSYSLPTPPWPATVQDFNNIPQVSSMEVLRAINKMNKRSAPGVDKILAESIHATKEALSGPYARLCTHSFRSCWYPQSWKNSMTVLIAKPGKPIGIKGLRPISLMSNLAKILDTVAATRLSHIAKLSSCSYAYQRGKSTADAVDKILRDTSSSRYLGGL